MAIAVAYSLLMTLKITKILQNKYFFPAFMAGAVACSLLMTLKITKIVQNLSRVLPF